MVFRVFLLLSVTSGYIHKGSIWVYNSQHKSVEKAGAISGGGRYKILQKGGRCSGAYWYQLSTGHWVCSPYFITSKKSPGGLKNWIDHMFNRQYFSGTGNLTHLGVSLKKIKNGKWRKLSQLRGFLPSYKFLLGQEPYVKTFSGGYVSSRSIKPLKPSSLMGLNVKSDDFPVAFIISSQAKLYKKSGGSYVPWKSIAKYSVRPVVKHSDGWYSVKYAPFAFLKPSDITVAPKIPQLLSGVKEDEHWLHVDISEKIMYAMKGKNPVRIMLFAASRKTMKGIHRIFLKRVYQNYDLQNVSDGYFLEAVPYVLYYNKGFAIHAAYWHDNFPIHETHGCINLSMKDARWLFTFMSPVFPRGYIELRSRKGMGSRVRIVG